ncbi:uncharacterized protein LOC114258381 isoform X2 [Camellia sinensis]|uniref:uncharacterized protein LOC114258381 isoform X2 n=1 Tax=Camellia sinensis TaxID=4442 RepID=UPI001035FACA|nr:uncharacterized protein LOC114258381 isoform X2 [Camellia sinensis]
MDLHAIVLFLCVCSHLVGHNGIEGDWRSLTKEEDLELEEQLKHLNKPAVKTIQMKPTSSPNGSRHQVSSEDSKPLHVGLKGGGCPVGTVPIKRTTKEDLIREKLASKIMTPADDTGGADVSYPSQSRLYSFTILVLHYCLFSIFGFICFYESPS